MEIPARLNPAKDQYQAADERLLINELRFNRLRKGSQKEAEFGTTAIETELIGTTIDRP